MNYNNSHFLTEALAAARAAEQVIMAYYQNQVDIEIKDDLTPVTIADQKSEQVIREHLSQAFPDHGFYGEEHGQENMDADYLWLIDPIDGTKSFIHGYGFFSTQIALMHQGSIILGVSSAPAMGELAWAEKGRGAWLNDQPIKCSEVQSIDQAAISTGNINSLAASTQWSALGEILSTANRTRGYGDFYHYHRLASGQLDGVIESDVNILDIAALSIIVEEAGGVFTELNGNAIDLETRSVLAAPPALHAKLLDQLNQPSI